MPGSGGPSGPPLGGLRPRPGASDGPDGLSSGTRRRITRGFLWGLLATGAMTLAIYAGLRTGLLARPEPVALALAEELAGDRLGTTLTLALAGTAHLFYGGFWGAVLSVARKRVRFVHGLLLGIALWVLMGLIIAPMADWGIFARELGYDVVVGTLATHLVYGATLGVLFERGQDHGNRETIGLKVARTSEP